MVRITEGQRSSGLDRVVTYHYQVAGQPYSNNRVRFGLQPVPNSMVPALGTTPNAVPAPTSGYPRGKSVRVYYNPRRPEDSVLHPTPNLRVWMILVAGLCLGYAAVTAAL